MDQQDKALVTIMSAVIGILVLIAITIFVVANVVVDTDVSADDDFRQQQAAKALQKPGRVVVAGTAAAEQEMQQQNTVTTVAAADDALDGEGLYQQVCAACHANGLLNAPKTGDKVAWEPRYQKGMDTLVKHAVNGFNQMPAQGAAPGATEDNIRQAISYMLTESDLQLAAADQAASASAESVSEAPASEESASRPQEVATEVVATETKTAPESASESASESAVDAIDQKAEVAAEASETSEAPETADVTPVVAAVGSMTQETNVTAAEPEASKPEPSKPEAVEPETVKSEAVAATEVKSTDVAATGFTLPEGLDLAEGKQVYDNVCRFCHMGNIPTAPKFGDKAAWGERLTKGWDTLKNHSLNGFQGMPAKGGRADLPDAQIVNALAYMIDNSR